jgi:cobalt-zinc-cadmium efflux system protein
MAHHHHHNHGSGAKRLGWTIVLNVGITIAEVIGGLVSGSLALLSDAGHNLSDVIALVLAYFGSRGAAMKPTKRSTYGFKRLEVVTALINALSLVAISVYIIIEAFHRYADPKEINAPVMLSVAVLGLLGNVLSVWILHRDRNKTINNRAAFLHMLYDAVSSVAVIIGGIIIIFSGWYLLDLILSVLIAMMILWSSLDILKEATGIFMEAVPQNIDIDEVSRSISSVDGVREAHHLHIWSISSTHVALSCHIRVSEEDASKIPIIISAVNKMLLEKHGIDHATIQPETDLCPEQPVQADLPLGESDDQ